MDVFKLHTKTRVMSSVPLIQAWMRMGFAATGGAVSYLAESASSTILWSQQGAFPVNSLPFKFEYRQVRPQFMNWLCLS